ncbi:MAG: lipocalin-like domain-containing protein [Candidatus Acidiferrum sp.]
MKKTLLLGAVFLFISVAGMMLYGGPHRGVSSEGIPGRFVGAWRLVSLEQQGSDGKIHRADSTGLLVFTRDGHMSVQVMESNPQPNPLLGLSSIRRAATRRPLAPSRSTKALTPSSST